MRTSILSWRHDDSGVDLERCVQTFPLNVEARRHVVAVLPIQMVVHVQRCGLELTLKVRVAGVIEMGCELAETQPPELRRTRSHEPPGRQASRAASAPEEAHLRVEVLT